MKGLAVLVLTAAMLFSAAGCGKKQTKDGVTVNGGGQSQTAGTAGMDDNSEGESRKVEVFGVVKCPDFFQISLEFPARVLGIPVIVGQTVRKGDKLIRLDIDAYRNQMKDSEHRLTTAKLNLEKIVNEHKITGTGVESDYNTLRNNIATGEKELALLKEDLLRKKELLESGRDPDLRTLENEKQTLEREIEKAETDLGKQEKLYERQAVAQSVLDDLRFLIRQKTTELSSIGLNISALKQSKGDAIRQLELKIVQTSASVDNLYLALNRLATPELTAIEIQKEQISTLEDEIAELNGRLARPFLTGVDIICPVEQAVVADISVTKGATLELGSALVTLLDLTSLVIEADVPEEFIRDIRVDALAEIKPVADPERIYTGKVKAVAGLAVNRNNETVVPVTITVDEPDEFLLPNFNVDVSIVSKPADMEKMLERQSTDEE